MSKSKKGEIESETVEDTEVVGVTEILELIDNTVVDSKIDEVKKEETKEKEPKKVFIYMGPNLNGGYLNYGSIHKGIPKHLREIFKTAPSVEKLFVEVKEVAKFKEEFKNQSSSTYITYCSAVEELKGV